MRKKCYKCKIEKDIKSFTKNKTRKDGLEPRCKSCAKEYRDANKERAAKYKKEYYQANKDKISASGKIYRELNKERIKDWREMNKERLSEYRKIYYKKYYQSNKEKFSENSKRYQKANKEKISEYQKQYRKANKGKRRNYIREKKKNDPLFKLSTVLRARTNEAFKRKCYSKNTKTHEMLGTDWGTVKSHIENQFTEGMTWNNHGEWHIDHIVPLSLANCEVELEALCYYENLQPLWAEDNFKKKNRI